GGTGLSRHRAGRESAARVAHRARPVWLRLPAWREGVRVVRARAPRSESAERTAPSSGAILGAPGARLPARLPGPTAGVGHATAPAETVVRAASLVRQHGQ